MMTEREQLEESVAYLSEIFGTQVADIALILGSGLGQFGEELSETIAIPYKEIPYFPVSTAPGHTGKLLTGDLGGRHIICMQGRFHHYEGYSMQTIAYPIKVLKLLGVKYLILTNAAGCLNEKWQPGDLMVISDHIKLQAESPLTGQQQDGLLGPRFFDMSNAYDAELRKYAREIASRQHIAIKEGVYQYFTGPNFETPAEIRAARLLGADAVGMSTVPEAITAAYLGLRTLGLSCLTNMGAGMTKKAIDGNDVLETSMKVKDTFTAYMKQLVTEWPR